MHSILPAFALLASPAADACTVAPGYRIPTTLELVEQADAVVVAQAWDTRTGDDGQPELDFVSITTLKGSHSGKGGSDRITVPRAYSGWLEAS